MCLTSAGNSSTPQGINPCQTAGIIVGTLILGGGPLNFGRTTTGGAPAPEDLDLRAAAIGLTTGSGTVASGSAAGAARAAGAAMPEAAGAAMPEAAGLALGEDSSPERDIAQAALRK